MLTVCGGCRSDRENEGLEAEGAFGAKDDRRK